MSDRFSLSWDSVLVSSDSVIVARLDGRGSGFQGQRILHEVHQRLGTVDVQDQIAAVEYVSIYTFAASPRFDQIRLSFLRVQKDPESALRSPVVLIVLQLFPGLSGNGDPDAGCGSVQRGSSSCFLRSSLPVSRKHLFCELTNVWGQRVKGETWTWREVPNNTSLSLAVARQQQQDMTVLLPGPSSWMEPANCKLDRKTVHWTLAGLILLQPTDDLQTLVFDGCFSVLMSHG